MLTLVYLALNDAAPSYISQPFTERSSSIRLLGRPKLVIHSVNTILTHFIIMLANYGTHYQIVLFVFQHLLLLLALH